MRRSLQRVVGGGFLFLLGVLSCSSRDNPEQHTATVQEDLTQAQITQILSFENTNAIGPGGDWVPSGGTVASSTLHASAGTHSMVMSSASSISVVSTSLSALGSVGANLGVDIWLPTTLTGQSNKGNIQAYFTSTTLSLNSYATSDVQLTTLTPGQFSKINIPLDSTLQSKLSQSSYSDLTIKFTFNLADTTNQTFVDNVTFSSGTGGSGGATGTGGTKSNGGATSIGGTKSVGGASAAGGTNSGGSKTGGAPSTGGTKSTGGVTGTGGKATGGNTATGGKSFTGGTVSTGGTKSNGGNVSTGGTKSTGGTVSTGGTKTSGGTPSTGGTVATGGTKATGGTVSTGGFKTSGGTHSTGGTISTGGTKATGGATFFVGTGGTPATGGNPATGGVIIVVGTGGAPGAGGVSSVGGIASAGGTSAGGSAITAGATSTSIGGSTNAGGSTGATGVGGNAGSGGSSAIPGLYTFSFQLPAGVNRNQVAFATTGGDLWLDDGVQVANGSGFASVSAVGGGKVNRIGVSTQVQNVWSGGDVTLANNAEVHGSLVTSGILNPQSGSKVDGTTTQQANLGPLQTISWNVTFPTITAPAVNVTTPQTYVPGGYPEVDIKTGAQLNLSKGTYTFNAMIVEPGGILNVDNSQGPVYIYLQNGFTFRGTVNTVTFQPNVLFGIAGTSPVIIDASFKGIVVAPSAGLSLSTTTGGHAGAFFAQSITAHQNTTIAQQSLQPANFCGPSDGCSSFCACPLGSYPCNGSSTNCDTGLTCDLTSNKCLCQTTCANKKCGDDPNDGCGGQCLNLCADGQTGCSNNLQCAPGSQCFIGGGPRLNFAPGTNICLPAICSNQSPQLPGCGVNGANCGPCPTSCGCKGKTCGDDGCGNSCGSVGTNQLCVQGNVVNQYNAAADHSSDFPGAMATANSPPTEVGATPGIFNVTTRGTAEYKVPIVVPPGRNGVQPNLGVLHVGGKGNGILGEGWALTGLSRIERCPWTVAQDGGARQITLTTNDKLCLDGQRLVLDDSSANPPSGGTQTYHTEIESFQVVTPFGNEINGNGAYVGPSGFTVKTKSGMTLTYGTMNRYDHGGGPMPSTTISDSIVVTGGVNRIWNLSKVQDQAGNYLAIAYRNITTDDGAIETTEIVPDFISYGGQATANEISKGSFQDLVNTVKFVYETRPDPRHHYLLGQWDYSTLRLTAIQTFATGQLVYSYNIGYIDGGHGESRLSTVTQCASTNGTSVNTCLPPTTFTYESPPVAPYSETGGTSADRQAIANVLDANGDGLDDLLLYDIDKQTLSLGISHWSVPSNDIPTPFVDVLTMTDITSQVGLRGIFGTYPLSIIDVNGDGMDDVVTQDTAGPSGEQALYYAISNGTGFTRTAGPATSCDSFFGLVGDFNGDGRKDRLCCKDHTYVEFQWNNGNGLTPDPYLIAFSGVCDKLLVFDRDGDGVDDLIAWPDFSYQNSTDFTTPLYLNRDNAFLGGNHPPEYLWLDAGFDYTLAAFGGNSLCLQTDPNCTFVTGETQGDAYANRAFFGLRNTLLLDVNGDGLKDVLMGTSSGGNQYDGSFPAVTVLWLNTGNGFKISSLDSTTSGMTMDWGGPGQSKIVTDYDGDGRDDIVDINAGQLWRGSSFGTLSGERLNEPNVPTGGVLTATTADLNGDGKTDWLFSRLFIAPYTPSPDCWSVPVPPGYHCYYPPTDPGSSPHGLEGVRWGRQSSEPTLTKVTEGNGKAIAIQYPDAINGGTLTFYQSSTQPVATDTMHLRRVAPLVQSYSVSQTTTNAQGNTNTTSNGLHIFKYFDAITGLNGRGWYGFSEIRENVYDNQNNLFQQRDTSYNNSTFWNAGKVKQTDVTSASLPSSSLHDSFSRETISNYNWQLLPSSSNESFVALTSSSTDIYESAGLVVTDTATSYSYGDGLGNVTDAKTTLTAYSGPSPEVDVTETTSTYDIHLDTWLISNPLLVAVTNTHAGTSQTRTTSYTYYSNGLPQSVTREPTATDVTQTVVTTFQRDPTTNNVTEVDTVGGDGQTRKSHIVYDSRQWFPTYYIVDKLESGSQFGTQVQYDPATGQLLTSMDPNGVTTRLEYDAFGRQRSTISPTETSMTTYNPGWFGDGVTTLGHPGAITIQTTITDNEAGRFEQKTFSESRDAFGAVIARVGTGISGVGLWQELTRDWAERVLTATVPHPIGDATQGAYNYTYDALGQVTSVTMPDSRVTTFDYVSNASASSGSGGVVTLFSDPNDSAVRAVFRTLPNNLTQITVLNHLGEPVRVIEAPSSSLTSISSVLNGESGTMSRYQYGVFGQLNSVMDPDGDWTSVNYDNLGRRKYVSSVSVGSRAFNYDSFDNVKSYTDGNNDTQCYVYDSLGRPTLQTKGNPDGTCSSLNDVVASWQYDGDNTGDDNAVGKLVTMYREASPGSGAGTTSHFYYENKLAPGSNTGRLQSIEQDMPGPTSLYPRLVTSLEYEGPLLSKVHYPALGGADFAVKYNHDRFSGAVTSVLRDGTGTSPVPYWQMTESDGGKRIKEEVFGNGVTTDYDYYAIVPGSNACNFPGSVDCMPGKLHSMTTTLPSDPTGNPTRHLQYAYDPLGNLNTLSSFHGTNKTDQQFIYDAYGRLTNQFNMSAAGIDSETTWTYSTAGDIQRVESDDFHSGTSSVQNYTYDPAKKHLLSNVTDSSGNITSYAFDGNANTKQRGGFGIPNANQNLQYSDLNLPWAVTGGTGGDTYLEYDATGNRVAKRGPTETTLYMGDLYECIGDTTTDGTINCNQQNFKIYANGSEIAVVTRESISLDQETPHYIHSDHLGSSTLITDAQGNVAENRSFDPFGNISTDLSHSSVRAGFTGQDHDQDLGFINMKGRLYDPNIRRFMSPDPFVSHPLDPQGLNRFSYVLNNPLNLIDPSGFEDEGDDGDDGDDGDFGPPPPATTTGGNNPTITISNFTITGSINGSTSGSDSNTTTGGNGDNSNSGYGNPDQTPVSGPTSNNAPSMPTSEVGGPGAPFYQPSITNPDNGPPALTGNPSSSGGTPNPTLGGPGVSGNKPSLQNFGPWQGLAMLNAYNQDALAVQRTPTVAFGTGLAGGTLAAAAPAVLLGAPTAGTGVLTIEGALYLKATGGVVAGVTNAALQGRGPGGIALQGGINGLVSMAAPFGSQGVISGIGNSIVSNIAVQTTNMAMGNGTQINGSTIILSGLSRGSIGYMIGTFGPQSSLEGVVLANAISGSFAAFSANWYNSMATE
jgi:RHS repeat-associated protein